MNELMIFDIDDTVSNTIQRRLYLQKDKPENEDWQRFFSEAGMDSPLRHNITFLKTLFKMNQIRNPDVQVLFLTGRPKSIQGVTQVWLNTYWTEPYSIICRPDGEWVNSVVFKKQQVEKLLLNNKIILYVDDQHENCSAVREVLHPSTIVLTVS